MISENTASIVFLTNFSSTDFYTFECYRSYIYIYICVCVCVCVCACVCWKICFIWIYNDIFNAKVYERNYYDHLFVCFFKSRYLSPKQQLLPNSSVKVAWIIIFSNPSARAGYDTRSIFKRSLTGLNSEFSFS